MRRRDFIMLSGVAAWPLAARAQQVRASVLSSVEPSSGAVRDQTEAAVIEISWPAERLANLATAPNYMLYCDLATPLVTDGGRNVLGNRLQVARRTKESAGDSNQTRAPRWPHRWAPQPSQYTIRKDRRGNAGQRGCTCKIRAKATPLILASVA